VGEAEYCISGVEYDAEPSGEIVTDPDVEACGTILPKLKFPVASIVIGVTMVAVAVAVA